MQESPRPLLIEIWSIDRFVLYARNPRKNDAAVDRMCSSIREFGCKGAGACPQRQNSRVGLSCPAESLKSNGPGREDENA